MMDDMSMADRRWFLLSPAAWEDFANHLERPAVFKPRLADLMSRESFWAADAACGNASNG